MKNDNIEFELRITTSDIRIVKIDYSLSGALGHETTVYFDADASRYLGKRVNDALHYFLKFEKEFHDEN